MKTIAHTIHLIIRNWVALTTKCRFAFVALNGRGVQYSNDGEDCCGGGCGCNGNCQCG